ncbi:MAG TPA: FAD-binding oxidoreductase [Candidatus Binataceae bacterium]|nr:FAD-binding oxidoreductase [Candidatus Binataceae bacterium]
MEKGQNGRCDVAIVGAGIIGSSLAMALGERGLRTVIVDIDLSGRLSSSERNAGGVRATWWQPVNIVLCRASIEYYEKIAAEVGFRQEGYLWLYDADTFAKAQTHLDLQRQLGHPIEELTPDEVAHRVPEIDRLDGVAGATLSPRDGLINPNLLKQHYRSRSREFGASYLDWIFIHSIEPQSGEVAIACWQADDNLPEDGLMRLMAQDAREAEAETGHLFELRADALAICSGAWSPNLVKLLGIDTPTEAIRRQICVVDNRVTNLAGHGMIVDSSGLYFHNEGPHILAGYSPPEEPAGYSFKYDGEDFFLKEIWPRLYARMSCFERLRHVTGWAGLYAVTPDRSAIIGRLGPRLFEAHSFSGRGVMQSYGAGQALADLIATGRYGKLDASALARERFQTGKLTPEELHI